MEQKREIPKDVRAPALCPEAVQLVTDACFLSAEEVAREKMCGEYGEVVIFGTPHAISHQQILQAFLDLCNDGYKPDTVYITGGEAVPGRVESDEIYALFHNNLFCQTRRRQLWFSSIQFRFDKSSRNTGENVQNAIELGLNGKTGIIFIAKSGHCGRAKLTLARYLPGANICALGYDAFFGDGLVSASRDTWFQNANVRDKVWAEFLRIELYGSRGDIAYPPDIRAKVERVLELTK